MRLEESGPKKQVELVEEFGLEEYAMSRLLAKLELHRYISRRREGTDRSLVSGVRAGGSIRIKVMRRGEKLSEALQVKGMLLHVLEKIFRGVFPPHWWENPLDGDRCG
jgi:DNA-binding MarR family transcriptional regulator